MVGLAPLLFVLGASAAGEDCVLRDDEGQPFAVCFDPGNGLELEAAALGRDGVWAPSFAAAIRVRSKRESVSKEGSLWFNEHRLLATRAQPDPGYRLLETTAYQGVFRRHLEEGFVLVPTARPIRLPFPFDLAIAVSVGRYERRVFEGRGFVFEAGRAAVLLDLLRSSTGRAHVAFGPALSHTLRHDGDDATQELSPLTSMLVDIGFESANGLWVMALEGIAGWVFTPGSEPTFRAGVDARLDRVLLAVNDHPVSIAARFGYQHADAGVHRRTEWTASVGLMLRAWGR